MKRRTFLAASATAAAASSFPAPAIAQGIRELKLVSSYPKVPRTELLARTITEVSGGRLSHSSTGGRPRPGGGFVTVWPRWDRAFRSPASRVLENS